MYDRSPSSKDLDELGRDIHFCATCQHIQPVKTHTGVQFICSRLGYETHPNWKFNCWTPRSTYVITKTINSSSTNSTHKSQKD